MSRQLASIIGLLVGFAVLIAPLNAHKEHSIRHIRDGHIHYVDLGTDNYAFSRQREGVLSTVSVNGDKVLLFNHDCGFDIEFKSDFDSNHQDDLKNIEGRLSEPSADYIPYAKDVETVIEVFRGTNKSNPKSKFIRNGTVKHFEYASSDDVKHNNGEKTFPGPHNYLRRTFISDNLIAYIFEDDFVLMKPRWCSLSDDLDQLSSQPSVQVWNSSGFGVPIQYPQGNYPTVVAQPPIMIAQ